MDNVLNHIWIRDALIKAKLGQVPTFSGWKLQDKFQWRGLLISIENKKGGIRKWQSEDGKHSGQTKMQYDYGYIRRTQGNDGDHIDCYIDRNNTSCSTVYIIHQNNPATGEFDEDKVMLGFNSATKAKAAYLHHYDSPKFFGSMTEMPLDVFRKKVVGKRVNKIG